MARKPGSVKLDRRPGEPGRKCLARIDRQRRAERHAKLIVRLAVKQGRPPAHYFKRLDRTVRNFHGRRETFKRLVATALLEMGVSTYEPVNHCRISELVFI